MTPQHHAQFGPPVRDRDWTTDRRARRILASLATNPPPVERIPHEDRWDREDTRFTGFRVQALGILRAAHQTPRFKAAQAAGDMAMCHRIADEPSVGDAVRAALVPVEAFTGLIAAIPPVVVAAAAFVLGARL